MTFTGNDRAADSISINAVVIAREGRACHSAVPLVPADTARFDGQRSGPTRAGRGERRRAHDVLAGEKSSRERDPSTILVVDDDSGVRQTVALALKFAGLRAAVAAYGGDAITMAQSLAVDLMLIDLWLDDMSGLSVVQELELVGAPVPFMLVSELLTTEIVEKAMQLGALDVQEKPFSMDDIVAKVVRMLDRRRTPRRRHSDRFAARAVAASRRMKYALPLEPKSAAERWASYVLRACESENDFKTLHDWAKYIGVSYTSLRESCRLVDILPHNARDFLRVLRALMSAGQNDRTHVEVLFDVSDARTLRSLLMRAGLSAGSRLGFLSIEEFLERQEFINVQNAALQTCRALLSERWDLSTRWSDR